jgi:hypothetical protein
MAEITPDQVVTAAKELGKDEFTRKDLAEKQTDIRRGVRGARQAGKLDKVRDDEQGTGHFRLTDK